MTNNYTLQNFKNWIGQKSEEWNKVFEEFNWKKNSGELFEWNSLLFDGIKKGYFYEGQEEFLKSREGELTLFCSFLLDGINFGKRSGQREKQEYFSRVFFAWLSNLEMQEHQCQLSQLEKEKSELETILEKFAKRNEDLEQEKQELSKQLAEMKFKLEEEIEAKVEVDTKK